MEEAGFHSFNVIAATFHEHYDEILNFYNNRSSNALAESFNAKVKLFRANLRGVADKKFFLFRIAKLYAPPKQESRSSKSAEPAHFPKRQLPTLPLLRSTIGVTGLNFSVRNGKRWIPHAITTLISFLILDLAHDQKNFASPFLAWTSNPSGFGKSRAISTARLRHH